MSDLLERTLRSARARLLPPPRLPLSRWIEQNIYLPPEVAARPGPVRLWPFQREIADAISDPTIERVTVRKAARVGYTTLLTGATASYIANEPAPILTLLPTDDSCRTYIVSDLEPIFDASPVVSGILSTAADEIRAGGWRLPLRDPRLIHVAQSDRRNRQPGPAASRRRGA